MGGGTSTAAAALLALAVAAARPGAARASPELDLADPAYLELAALRAAGALPPYLGGLRPLTEARVQSLRLAAGLPPDPRLLPGSMRGLWIAPLRQLRLRGLLARDHLRPYSTEIHRRDLAGGVALTCEHRQGRACGAGAGLEWELDSTAGLGTWLAAAARLRAVAGTADLDPAVRVDRASAGAELGPFALLVGRSVLVLGPSSRTQAMWSDHPPALDQVRLSTARPFPLAGADGSILRASAVYFLGRLREPQRFDGTLVDGTRLQLDLWNTAELGATHLIQLGGDGAPDFSAGDYLLEHTRHNAESGEFANHRLSVDAAISLPRLAGLRVTYELAAEDLRDEVLSMLRRDADHVLGVELAPRGVSLLVELSRTGIRSHEHQLFTTGVTSRARIAGAPLGPASTALFAGARVPLGPGWSVAPSLELARQSADLYVFGTGEIRRTADLPDETRARARGRTSAQLRPDLVVDAGLELERVTTADFMPGHTRWNAGLELTATWTPMWRLAR
jgi:hypothetical protein